jgi:hypothetical protein
VRAITTLTAILSVWLVTTAIAQQPAADDSRLDSPVKARVDALMQRSRQAGSDDGTWEEVRDEVDGLFSRADTGDQSRQVEDRLRRLLTGHEPNPEYSRRPLVRIADLRNGRSLITAYVILRGSHDVAVLRGYVEGPDGRFLPVANLTEFDGHTLFLEELFPPVDGESWFIGWGRAHGANGNWTRVRVFSFDGSEFRVLWSPPDMSNVTVLVTDRGFDLTHHTADINPPAFVTEEFVLTPAGPDRLGTTILDTERPRRD